MTLEQNVKYAGITTGVACFAAGALRAYQEDVLGIQDHTLSSDVIQSSLLFPMGAGAAAGAVIGTQGAFDVPRWGLEVKVALPIAGITAGAAAAGAISYTATALGYFAGKTACYLMK